MTIQTIDPTDLAPSSPISGGSESDRASVPLDGLDAALAAADSDKRALGDWVRTYLMRPHPDLGRSGHVCPFTAQATRLSLLRIGTSPETAEADILDTMHAALRAFDALPATRGTRIFCTIIIGFPNCRGEGVATLLRVQNALRHHSILRGKMIGLFEPDSQAEGLINRAFRPLRAPVPTLAIRLLVVQDAPFVIRNPLLLPIYLAKFPLDGTRRLAALALPRPAAWLGRTTTRLATWGRTCR